MTERSREAEAAIALCELFLVQKASRRVPEGFHKGSRRGPEGAQKDPRRVLEGVQKGKIESVTTGVSPRSVEDRESEGEEVNFQPEQVMKLQLEVLEGENFNIVTWSLLTHIRDVLIKSK